MLKLFSLILLLSIVFVANAAAQVAYQINSPKVGHLYFITVAAIALLMGFKFGLLDTIREYFYKKQSVPLKKRKPVLFFDLLLYQAKYRKNENNRLYLDEEGTRVLLLAMYCLAFFLSVWFFIVNFEYIIGLI